MTVDFFEEFRRDVGECYRRHAVDADYELAVALDALDVTFGPFECAFDDSDAFPLVVFRLVVAEEHYVGVVA